MGKNFTIRYRLLDLKSNPDFKDLSQDYKNALRGWYNYNWGLNYKEKDIKIPKPLIPNLLLAGLFRDEEVDTKIGNYLASVLEKHTNENVLA